MFYIYIYKCTKKKDDSTNIIFSTRFGNQAFLRRIGYNAVTTVFSMFTLYLSYTRLYNSTRRLDDILCWFATQGNDEVKQTKIVA